MATTTGGHTLNLMACVRESSPPQDSGVETDVARNETKRKRFHPFRGLRRMFRRKVRHSGTVMPAPSDPPVEPTPVTLDTHRSRSTSELLAGDEPTRRRSGSGFYGGHSGLSVSHDSIFSAEQHSNHSSSEDMGQSSSSLSIQQIVLPGVKAELFDAVRRRRGGGGNGRGDTSEDDEDLGLPRSPCISPTTVDVLLEKGHKENPTKSHSTCSDGSLLSMGSSEMDEDSLGEHSGHSSKLSLHDKKLFYDNDSELDLGISATPLSHSAARHKMSVRPKRTHGAPRRRRTQQLSVVSELPTTPEVNEESFGRSYSPDKKLSDFNPELNASAEPLDSQNIWLPNENPITTETQLKSASLPPGLALSSEIPSVLSRSRSSASKNTEISSPPYRRNFSTSELEMKEPKAPNQIGAEVLRSREFLGGVGEEDEDEDRIEEKKKEESFFGRLLSRRSGKKKKDKVDGEESKVKAPEIPKRIDEKGRYANEISRTYESNNVRKIPLRRRQREPSPIKEPINLPPSPEPRKKDPDNYLESNYLLGVSPTKSDTAINRMQISYSASPPKPTWPEGSIYSKHSETETKIVDYVAKSKPEEQVFKPKLRIGGLTSYQQKLTNTNESYDERDYSSLVHTNNDEDSLKNNIMLKKSRSFRENIDTPSFESDYPSISLGMTNDSLDYHTSNNYTTHVNNIDNQDLSADSNVDSLMKDVEVIVDATDKTQDPHKGIFTKHIFVTTRSVLKETKVKPDIGLKKSTSLESISSIDNTSPGYHLTTRSSSTESISSLTQQITTSPVDSGGISITQTVAAVKEDSSGGENSHNKITLQSMPEETRHDVTPITVSITSKPVETTNENIFNFNTPISDESSAEVSPVSPRSQASRKENVRNTQVSESSHIPEFMRVQLNRIDSKPALNIVLSTSAIFEAEKTEDVSKPLADTFISKDVEVAHDHKAKEVPQVSLLGLRIKKASREDLHILESPKLVEKLDNFTFRTQELIQKPFETKAEPIAKPRSISLIPMSTQPSKIVPLVTSPTTPTRLILKKQSSSLELDEVQNEIKSRRFTSDCENIQIVEKEAVKPTSPKLKTVSNDAVIPKKPETVSDTPEVVLRKKVSVVRDLSPKLDDIVIIEKPTSGDESPEVVLRKKSRDFGQRRDEEPELLKVFARRSLKIKDSDTEAIGQLVAKKESQVSEPATKSRDSDKENEGDSPKEERKKQIATKEPLVESKPRAEETKIPSVPTTGFTPRLPFKYQRSVSIVGSSPVVEINSKENNLITEKRHRKSVPDGPTTIGDKLSNRWTNIYKDKEIDLTNTELNKPLPIQVKPDVEIENEENVPRFKRIQQRKEEWELRAQQAAKKTIP